MSDFATAGGHWYLPNGEPYYRIVGANGKERDVTLRDARKVNAVPSVTGIIRCAAAPQLQKWIIREAVTSALTIPRIEGETSDALVARIEVDRQEQVKVAAARGEAIHGAIERHYRGEVPDPDLLPWVQQASAFIAGATGTEQEWRAERSFAHALGYGGKTDLHSDQWVIDVKTKDGELPDKLYDEHVMQLAAYRHGLGIPAARGAILFVGREKPCAALVEASESDLRRGMDMFLGLLNYWCAKNDYRP
jgi:hypothetical protein